MGIGDVLTAVSILIALGVALYQLRKQRREQQTAHTIDLLARTFEDGPIFRSRLEVLSWILSGKALDLDKMDREADLQAATLLNFYDFLATLISKGDLDTEVIQKTLGGVIARDVRFLMPYITERRVRSGRDSLYRNLEHVALERFADAP